MLGDQSEEGNGLASEFGDGGKRDLLVLLLRDVLDDRLSPAILVSSGRGLVPIFHRAKPHPDWSLTP